MKTRIIEIDQLKGLAMCLVVVWHVAGYVFGLNDDFVLLSRFIMPLFFFLSGLVSITEARPFNEFIPYLYKKSCSLLIPFFVVGTLFAHTQNVSIIGMLSTAFKCGYYYLLVLFIYSIILFFFNQVSAHITNRKVLNDLILSFSLFAITVVIEKIIKIYDVDMVSYTSIVQISKNILPFFLGVIVNKYKLLYFIKKELVFTLSLSIFGIFSYLNFCCDLHLHNVFYQIFSQIIGVSAIFWIVYLFFCRTRHNIFLSTLAYIGTRTLDIYVLHYFILRIIHLDNLSLYLHSTNNQLVEYVLNISISILVILTCLLIGNLIRSSRYLKFIIFGGILPKKVLTENN